MKRILFVGLSLLVAIGCADSKPVSTANNTTGESSAATSEQDGDAESGRVADDTDESTAGVQQSTIAQESDEDSVPFDDGDAEPEVEMSLAEQYRKLVSDFRVQMFKLRKEQQAATPDEQEKIAQTLQALQPQLALDVRQIFVGQEDDPAFIDAVPLFIMSLPDSEMDDVLSNIAEHHLENEKWFEMCIAMQNINKPQFVNFIEKQATEGSGKNQIAAKFVLANTLNAETDEARIVELLQSVIDYDGELMIQGSFDLKSQADDKLFTLTKLAIGKEAPEIEGEDSEGVTFKLSDYRGKVVMLDFWGNW